MNTITITLTAQQLEDAIAGIKSSKGDAAVQPFLPAPALRSPGGFDNVQAYTAAVRADANLPDTGNAPNPALYVLVAEAQANFQTFYGAPMSIVQALAANSAQPAS